MQQYSKEFERKPFDPVTFIERLAWKVLENSKSKPDCSFDADGLEETFSQCIKDLKVLLVKQGNKCKLLEAQYKEEEQIHLEDLINHQLANRECIDTFRELDDKVNCVAGKVMHLGAQLESVNIPRLRAVEAQKLMACFSEFLGSGPPYVDLSSIEKMNETADILQKLFLIAQELPPGRFSDAKKKIESKYDEIERILIEQFVKAQSQKYVSQMKEITKVLSHFKGYSQCVDAFIEQSQTGNTNCNDVFAEVELLCVENFQLIEEVFQNPEQVNCKFLLNMYHLKILNHINAVLSESKDTDKYLQNLMDLYTRLNQLSSNLSRYNLGNDDLFLKKLAHNIFHKYIESYISVELKNFKEKCSRLLEKYYNSIGHQKKQIYAGSFQELKRELKAAIGTRTNINLVQMDDYGGETFLSEPVTIFILQEAREAFQRCNLFSDPKDLQSNATQLFDILLQYLILEYLNYAIDLGIQSVPIPEVKIQPPEIYFFEIVQQSSIVVHFLEKHFTDHVLPLIGTGSALDDCLSKKSCVLDETETKLDTGIDRSINAVVGWIKLYLQTEQKRTDFKPETNVDIVASAACKTVVQFMKKVIQIIKGCLSGKNKENSLLELGMRFHRIIYEHLLQYSYNEAGALCAICEVDEYRKCVKDLDFPFVIKGFDTLYALCNLLLVKSENLEEVCSGETLAVLDNSILLNFIQLRSDYRWQKLNVKRFHVVK